MLFDSLGNILGYRSTTVPEFMDTDPRHRYKNPNQSEVVAFIQNHADELDPWFREESYRRGILKR